MIHVMVQLQPPSKRNIILWSDDMVWSDGAVLRHYWRKWKFWTSVGDTFMVNPLRRSTFVTKIRMQKILVILRLYWNPITLVLIWKVVRQAFRWYHYFWNPSTLWWQLYNFLKLKIPSVIKWLKFIFFCVIFWSRCLSTRINEIFCIFVKNNNILNLFFNSEFETDLKF
jgi:hypothetical protein